MSDLWLPTANSADYKEEILYNEKGEALAIRHETPNIKSIVDHLANIRKDADKRYGEKRSFHPVAEIPAEVLIEWKNKYDCDLISRSSPDDLKLAKKLLNGDYGYLKTKPVIL